MPDESLARRKGRVEYIEPNNLFIQSTGNKVQNGIPQPYEDYSFSVNLRVINGNRYDCGMPGDGKDISRDFVEFSSDRGTLSFIDGTGDPGQMGYLTTNFTDISMNDPSTNTRECLGIESISVKFNSWYTPMVDIKFIDVRGASLMQPAEYEYYNNGGPNFEKGRNDSSVSNSDFFKAFFSFPYPMFKLSIKGFYGKEVTYDLSVAKCNVEFNSSTGNFEVATSFIGYMYGMYADLPFPFIYLAPYIDLYGANTWAEKKASGDFCYLPGDAKDRNGQPLAREMDTFPELKELVKSTAEEADKQLMQEEPGKTMAAYDLLIKKLTREVLGFYPLSSTKRSWMSWSKGEEDGKKPGYFILSVDDKKDVDKDIFKDFLKFANATKEYNEMAEKSACTISKKIVTKEFFDEIYDTAKSVVSERTKQTTESLVVAEYTDEEMKKIMNGKVVTIMFHSESGANNTQRLIYDKELSDFGDPSQESAFKDLIDELIRRFNEKEVNTPIQPSRTKKEWKIKAIWMDDIRYKDGLVDVNNNLSSEYNKFKVELDKQREDFITQTLGFNPSIRNIYNLIFAHIDTFMSVFYNTLDRIRQSIQSSTDDTRKKENFCGSNITVDVNENTLRSPASHGGKLPPFTMFYREESVKDSEDRKQVMVWPGSLPGGENLDEVKFVEALLNATTLTRKPYSYVTPKDNAVQREGNLVPTNYYDLIRNDGGNPYLDVLKNEQNTIGDPLNDVIRIFAFRCYYSLLSGNYLAPESEESIKTMGAARASENAADKARLVAELEVGNVVRAFQMLGIKPPQNFVTRLLQAANDGGTFVNEYCNDKNKIFTTTGNGKLSYRWIKRADAYHYPVGTFNPTVLDNILKGGNLGKNQTKFIQIKPEVGTTQTGHACRLFNSYDYIPKKLYKYTSGDFVNAARLFPSASGATNIGFLSSAGKGDITSTKLRDILDAKITIPSARRTSAGLTNIFVDPLYYSQTSVLARAYLFLLGIPYGKNKDFFLPENVENGTYQIAMLLREGAVYWRNDWLQCKKEGYAQNDPINYKYTVNGVTYDASQEVETLDPCLGSVYPETKLPKNVSTGRRDLLKRYFIKWATGSREYDDTLPTTCGGGVTADTAEKIEIPQPPVSFQTIERTFALQVQKGNVKVVLDGETGTTLLASTSTTVSSFANASGLREAYDIPADGKLGTLNGRIRTGVTLNPNNTTLTPLLYGNTIIDYSLVATTGVDKAALAEGITAFIKGLKEEYKVSAKHGTTGSSTLGEPADGYKKPENFRDDDLKLACYIALKNMYDRWLCSRRRECWQFTCKDHQRGAGRIQSDFDRFFYIDEFYHDVGMKIRPNTSDFVEKASDLGGFTSKTNEFDLSSKSILKMLSITADLTKCALLPLPTMLGLAKSAEDENYSIEDVFKAFPYNEAVKSNDLESSFVVLYTSQKSSILRNEDEKGKNAYKDDGFDIANTWGEIVPMVSLTDGSEDDFVVRCFGVTFAKQNQSYFQNLHLSMEDHQLTEFAIRNTVMISYANNRGPKETSLIGQDLYSVYSNYSYSCTVEMMGDAQITPLMYFQLNNIAMWKGAYMITSVDHNISCRGMTTTFKGVRQARPTLPDKSEKIILEANSAAGQTPYDQDQEMVGTPKDANMDMSERPLDKIDIERVNSVVFQLDRTSLRESGRWVNGILSVRIYYSDGTTDIFENKAETIEASHGLVGKIENVRPEDNEVLFALPSGKFQKVSLEYAGPGEEYRDPNDSFLKFTEKKHLVISDSALGMKKCEIIPGIENYLPFEAGGFDALCIGGMAPIMLFGDVVKEGEANIPGSYDSIEIRELYREIFNFVRRLNEAKKPVTFLVNEPSGIEEMITEPLFGE